MSRRFFDPQNSLWYWFGKVPDTLLLSLLWLILSLPVLTLPAASAALYDCVARNMRHDEKGLYRRFFRTFRKELLRSVQIAPVWAILAAVLAFGYRSITAQADQSSTMAVYALVYQISLLIPIAVFFWLIPIESRFVYSFSQLHKTAVAFTFSYLPRTAMLLVLTFLAVTVCRYVPILTILLPALIAVLHSLVIEKVFEAHTPEEA